VAEFPPNPPSATPSLKRNRIFGQTDGGTKRKIQKNKLVKTLAPPSHARVFDILLPNLFTIPKYFGNIKL